MCRRTLLHTTIMSAIISVTKSCCSTVGRCVNGQACRIIRVAKQQLLVEHLVVSQRHQTIVCRLTPCRKCRHHTEDETIFTLHIPEYLSLLSDQNRCYCCSYPAKCAAHYRPFAGKHVGKAPRCYNHSRHEQPHIPHQYHC